MTESFHIPVLLQSAIHFLDVHPGRKYIDCTVGGGGHAKAILGLGGKVLGLDQDPEAISVCPKSTDLILELTNFTHLTEVAKKHAWAPVSGILVDLGVSSHQLNSARRGFSYKLDGPIDMRMDPTISFTASDLLNTLPVNELASILKTYGEIPTSLSLAKKLFNARPISTTIQFSQIASRYSQQAFQALRIAVNDELGAIVSLLPQCLNLLEKGGKLVVISFHSLEDRLIKRQFSEWEQKKIGNVQTKLPVIASPDEVTANSRSKSAKLRVFQKHV